MALTVRFSRKGFPAFSKHELSPFLRLHYRRVAFLSSCLRLGKALDCTRRGKISDLALQVDKDCLKITIKQDADHCIEAEMQALGDEQANLQQALGMQIAVRTVTNAL